MIKQDIHSWIESNKEKIIELRRWLHRNPEVGFKEFRTSQYLSKILSDKGYDIVKNHKFSPPSRPPPPKKKCIICNVTDSAKN